MQAKIKKSLGGTLVLLSLYLGVVASEIIAFINTTTTTLMGLPYTAAFFLGQAMLFGFIGIFLFESKPRNGD
ncbi:MAG: hypothetical protein ACXAAO_00325 [Candidatus Thorarchaeota archaeon]